MARRRDDAPLAAVRIVEMDPRDLVLLRRNARYMPVEKYQRLVDNVRRDGCLTSVPFAALIRTGKDKGRYEVRSGNHRVSAAIDADLERIAVMVCDDPLTADRLLALQLSHNAIDGEDDPAILRDLYAAIEDVDWRAYSGLDDVTLDLMGAVEPIPLAEPDLTYQIVTLAFLPSDADAVAGALEHARHLIPPGSTWMASIADYDATLDALAVVAGSTAVRNQAEALRVLVDLAAAHYDDLVDAWWDRDRNEPRHPDWVPLPAVFGVDAMPPEAAHIVRLAMERAVDAGDVPADVPWRLLELLAADYLAGT